MRRLRRATRFPIVLLPLALAGPVAAQDLPESSPEALAHHAKGIELYVKQDYNQAIEHFYKAFEADPTFHVALLMAGVSHFNAGRPAQADSLYAIVAQHKDHLSSYYRFRLEAQMASGAGDVARAAAIMRGMAQDFPGTKAVYNLALWAANTNHPTEARTALKTLDPAREPMRGWYSYFDVYGNAAHALGDYEDELESAREGRSLFPGDIRAADDEVLALASLGRMAELDKVLEEVASMPAFGAINPGTVLVGAGQELGAHGRAADSKKYFERAVAWYDGRPATEQASQNMRSGKGYALYSLGRYNEAAPVYEALAHDFPTNGAWQAWTGYLAGLHGDKAKANEMARKIEAGEVQLSVANGAFWRGFIATGVGEYDKAVSLFRGSGVRARVMHRDPVIIKTILSKPEFVAYLKPEG